MNNNLVYVSTTFCLSIHLSVDSWVASAFLAIMNNADIRIGV